MNILHLHTGLDLTCGISKTIFLIAKYHAGGNKHSVLALDGNAGEKFIQAGINVKFTGSDSGILKNVFYLRDYVKENKIDIIHSHHRYFDFISYLVSPAGKIKRVTSVQSFVYGKKLFSYKSPLLLAAGESVKKHLIEYFGIKEERIIVFNNFVDTSEGMNSRPGKDVRVELGIPETEYVIGYIGRFSIREKGIDILVNAFEKFNEKYPGTRLVMVGGGEDIKKINIPGNVIAIEARQNIFDYYNMLDCIVLPSRVDPFPLTVLEAGMMKIPFIGSDVNGMPEIISDNTDGLLFESENPDMLCERLKRFYLDRKFAEECSKKLYEKVVEKYNCRIAVEKLNIIYEKL